MVRLRRYIWRTVLLPSLGVTGLLISLDCLFSFVYELEYLGGNYHALQALQFVLTTVPRRFCDFLPMGVLLGTLLGLGMMANSGELLVIRSAGVSTGKISWFVLRPAILLLAISLLASEFVVPWTEQVAQSNRAIARGGGDKPMEYGYWHREGNEFIHINAVQPNGVLYGVTRYRFNDNQELVETQFDRRAIFQGDHWFLEGIRGTLLEGDKVETYRKSTGNWQTGLTPQILSIIVLDPAHIALRKLWSYSSYLKNQGLSADEYMLAFWQKVFMPPATLGMVLIAISFIFGPLREVSMGLRLTAGIVAGLSFHYGQQFFGHLSEVFHTSPFMAAMVPSVICLIVGVLMLRRVR